MASELNVGKIGVGTSAFRAGEQLSVSGGANDGTVLVSTDEASSKDAGYWMATDYDGTANYAAITLDQSADELKLFNNNSVRSDIAITSTGLCKFGTGIAFSSQTNTSATGAAMVATTLNHYEEGTWTPVLTGTTATIGGAYAVGTYTRIGNLVYVGWYSGALTLASSSGSAKIGGLPFPVISEYKAFNPFSYQHGNAVDGNSRGGYFSMGTSEMIFIDDGVLTSATYIDGSALYIMISGVYKVA